MRKPKYDLEVILVVDQPCFVKASESGVFDEAALKSVSKQLKSVSGDMVPQALHHRHTQGFKRMKVGEVRIVHMSLKGNMITLANSDDAEVLKRVNARSRIYLNAHGRSDVSEGFGDSHGNFVTCEQFVAFFTAYCRCDTLRLVAAERKLKISLLICQAGKVENPKTQQALALNLYDNLLERNVYCELFARVGDTQVATHAAFGAGRYQLLGVKKSDKATRYSEYYKDLWPLSKIRITHEHGRTVVSDAYDDMPISAVLTDFYDEVFAELLREARATSVTEKSEALSQLLGDITDMLSSIKMMTGGTVDKAYRIANDYPGGSDKLCDAMRERFAKALTHAALLQPNVGADNPDSAKATLEKILASIDPLQAKLAEG